MTDTLPGTPVGHRRAALQVAADDLVDRAAELHALGFRLALVAAHDDAAYSDAPYDAAAYDQVGDGDGSCADPPGRPGGLRAVYLYTAGAPDRRVELHVSVDRDRPDVPSLAGLSFPAGRFEREMHDLYGINPVGHPLPRRLVRHRHWPSGWHAMRHDAGPLPDFTDHGEPFPFLTVAGPGVYEIPVGPVHAGLIEPGHFRFSVVGETILKLKARLWYVHKGIERLFEARPVDAGLPLAERISGDTAVGHALAYCRAVEDALGVELDPDAGRIRAIVLELERLYNHAGDIGALCNDVGHSVLYAHAMRVRERLLRINADTTGHRLLRGGVRVGGASIVRMPDPHALAAIGADIVEIAQLALSNSLVAERFSATAVLTKQQARDLGTLGYVARASGVDVDARRDHPTGVLAGLGPDPVAGGGDVSAVPVQSTGDVLARMAQRIAEVEVSIAMLDRLVGAVSELNPRPAVGPSLGGHTRSGVGIVEGWRGTIVHRVEVGPTGRLVRTKVVDPSFLNWPALPVALANTIVPDFPLVNKSFNLSYAGNDL